MTSSTSTINPHDTADLSPPSREQEPHGPPGGGRFRISGADLSASIAVFLISLPLSLGIALATGAPLQAGLVAAACGGLIAGRVGGSALQVSGPAAGLTVVTADLIVQYGWRTTCAITVLAGLAQIGLAALRVARSALAVSPAIVHGMLAGIGITIAVAQVHIVLGGTPTARSSTTSATCRPNSPPCSPRRSWSARSPWGCCWPGRGCPAGARGSPRSSPPRWSRSPGPPPPRSSRG